MLCTVFRVCDTKLKALGRLALLRAIFVDKRFTVKVGSTRFVHAAPDETAGRE